MEGTRMNANELAEIIEHLENARYIGASKAATMLRQQQNEIEMLKAKLNKYHLKEDLDRNLDLIYGKEFIK